MEKEEKCGEESCRAEVMHGLLAFLAQEEENQNKRKTEAEKK